MSNKVNLDTSEQLDITCRQGDTFSLTLTLKDSSGNALALSTDSYEFVMQVWGSGRGRNGAPLIASINRGLKGQDLKTEEIPGSAYFEEFTVDDNGNVTITASATTMRSVPAGRHLYDLQYILPTTSGVDTHTTVLRGTFTVNEDVTKMRKR
tara:strand:+ start:1223 stop:1678 length:456 start_codon:yes stop_codon:yes gene_type:complete